jgi:hypothetical protein
MLHLLGDDAESIGQDFTSNISILIHPIILTLSGVPGESGVSTREIEAYTVLLVFSTYLFL